MNSGPFAANNNPIYNQAGRPTVAPLPFMTTTTTTEAPYVHNLKHVLHLSLLFFEAQRNERGPIAVSTYQTFDSLTDEHFFTYLGLTLLGAHQILLTGRRVSIMGRCVT